MTRNSLSRWITAVAAVGCLSQVAPSFAQDASGHADDSAELAKKLQNPIASLISVPVQNNFDFGYGQTNAMRYTANIQPVIPVSLSAEWNVITRTIVPILYQEATTPDGHDQAALGDILQSFFFSPVEAVGGWIVGVGPALFYPSATENELGTGKFSVGPTIVLLQQTGGWTYGALANQLWSVAGEGERDDVNSTFLQPFLSYTTKTFTAFALNTESTYDWEHDQWTVPLNLMVSQLLKIGSQPIQFMLGGKYFADKPDGGPEWGLRFQVTLVFPK